MQDLVGIVRQEGEMLQALERLRELRAASNQISVDGNREYNAGWHTALDLHHLLTVSEIVTRAALERKESRGAHFRDDFPGKDNRFGAVNMVVRKDAGGEMKFSSEPVPAMRQDLQQIIEEMK
jgi:succinate dehydrogenase / fumarate reductase flavoprotein subunit